MTDGLTIANAQLSGQTVRQNGYQSDALREVRARASTVDQGSSAEEQRSLRRLNQVLDQNQPPRDNVPRGYYLNIKI
ncbi:MAG: hypothetical protein CMF67_07235 [Magnetovibrio sp.]|nr:hypothetical protein [Magnetovibrio sp.]